MEYRLVTCTSLVNKITKKDTLFHGKYTVDPYQNCEFGCIYCDSSTDETIYVKSNAVEIFEKEIEKLRKGVVIVGSVHDPYQKAENIYKLTRNILHIIKKHDFPCHILTKSNMVLRDLDLLSKIDRCIVTISITTLDESVSNIFEKNVPPPKERLKTVKTLSEKGIKTGVALIPVIPYVVETELEEIVKSVSLYKACYIIYKHLELRGDQKTLFKKTIEENYPHLLQRYEELYKNRYIPNKNYISKLDNRMHIYCKKYEIAGKI